MSNIVLLPLLSQYELLERLAENLSTLDLFHLAITCTKLYTVIRGSQSLFDRLMRVALCDGRGLKARQEFQLPYFLRAEWFIFEKRGQLMHSYDEELEVRVWNRKCDATNALPCLRCGVNVCEECRFVPRVRDMPGFRSRRRPHLSPGYYLHNIICYCMSCDVHVENDLPLRLSEYCDCDQYTRWICLPCKFKEDQPDAYYYRTRTVGEWKWEGRAPDEEEGMWIHDHQENRAIWCPCGKRAPREGNIRCAWCRRRHNRETYRKENSDVIPFFDDDPCYPQIEYCSEGRNTTYPDLGYRGPIAP